MGEKIADLGAFCGIGCIFATPNACNMLKTAFTMLPMFISLFWFLMFIAENNRNKSIRVILVAFFGVAFLLYTSHALFFNYEIDTYLYFDAVYNFATIAVYPIYFLYVIYLTRETSFHLKYILLLLPAVLLGATTAVLYGFMGTDESKYFIRQVLYHEGNPDNLSVAGKLQLIRYRSVPVIFTAQLVVIILAGSQFIINFDERVKNFYSNTEGKELRWTRLLFITFAIFSVFSMAANVLGRTFFLPEEWLVIPSLIFSVLIFVVGYVSYNQRFTAMDIRQDEDVLSSAEVSFDDSDPDYLLSVSQNSDLKNRLRILLEEDKIYTQKDLRVVDVSIRLHTNRTYISRLINQEYGKSFSDLINHYRFEEAKMMLISPGYSLLSIGEIANKAGFPSESSFYRVFKKETGMAPGDWRKVNNRIKA